MIRIEVKTTAINERSGTAQKTGRPYSIRTQDAWAHTFDPLGKPHPYPTRISLQLDDNQLAYAVGNYELSPASIYVGEFGRLMLGRPQLTQIAPQQVKAA